MVKDPIQETWNNRLKADKMDKGRNLANEALIPLEANNYSLTQIILPKDLEY